MSSLATAQSVLACMSIGLFIAGGINQKFGTASVMCFLVLAISVVVANLMHMI